MKTSHTFFCDEAGNSGGQYFHPDQPIYAEGGWVISHGQRAAAMEFVADLEKTRGYSPRTKGSFLKSAAAGRAYMEEAQVGLGQIGAPFLYLVEKRYFACSKAVETYFDPNSNSAVAPDETKRPIAYRMRAEKLYAAPDTLIAAFAQAYRGHDAAGIEAVGKDWEEFLISTGDVVMATELRAGLSGIRRNMRKELISDEKPPFPSGLDCLNMPSMARVFQLVEQHCPPCDMVHGECAGFEAAYRYVFDQLRNIDAAELETVDGRKRAFGFTRLTSLSFADSEEQPLLRVSDYLVASCVDFAQRAAADAEIPSGLAQCAYPGLGGILSWVLSQMLPVERRVRQMGEAVASDSWMRRVFGTFYKMTRPDQPVGR